MGGDVREREGFEIGAVSRVRSPTSWPLRSCEGRLEPRRGWERREARGTGCSNQRNLPLSLELSLSEPLG